MITIRNIGVIVIIIVLALATGAPGHGGGGGGSDPVFVETSDPTGVTFVETSDPTGVKIETSDPSGVTFGTTGPSGETEYTPSEDAVAAAKDYLQEVDYSALAQDSDGKISDAYVQAIKDLTNKQDLDSDGSKYALLNYKDLPLNSSEVMDLMLNIPAQDMDADILKDVWNILPSNEYTRMSAVQAQSTLAVLTFDTTISLQSEEKQDYLGLLDAIANKGDLVEEATANALGKILDPAKLAQAP